MKITKYSLTTEKKGIDIRLAVVSDLHARPYAGVIASLKAISPHMILLPGDIVEISCPYMEKRNKTGLDFLREAAKIAPCYYSYGNHELYNSHARKGYEKASNKTLLAKNAERIREYGVNIVNDSFVTFQGNREILIGGLVCGRDMDPETRSIGIDKGFISELSSADGYKILLCHYPHLYDQHLKSSDIDLILSGHAHGGQWRVFGRGVYAPHQGLFPKYTSGIFDRRHIISRGAVNNAFPIPRFFNSPEILEINIKSI